MNARAMVALGATVAGLIVGATARADACGDGAHWYRVGSDSRKAEG